MSGSRPNLTQDVVQDILADYVDNVPVNVIADRYGISRGAVSYHAVKAGLARRPRSTPSAREQKRRGPAPKRPPVVADHLWRARAACAGHQDDPGFFPQDIPSAYDRRTAIARVIELCNDCPVASDCRAFARANHVTAGVWAGKDYGAKRRPTLQETA